MKPYRLFLACLIALVAAQASRGDEVRPRIGLVLSGGGARGGAHLGVLKVLEELRIPVDLVVGTSAGAIVGAAYASGMPLAELEAEMRPLRTEQLFRDTARADLAMRRKDDDESNYIGPEFGVSSQGLALPQGAVAGVSLEAVLRRLTARQATDRFDRLPIPFRAVATDLTTAEMVVIDHGSLATAVRASMALPAVVNPVELDGRLLVDGGVSRNLPIDVARAMGAEVIIAVNIGTPLRTRQELGSLLTVSDQMVKMLINRNVEQSLRELKPGDVLITPDLGTITTADFDRLMDSAEAGALAARAAAPELERYRVPVEVYALWGTTRRADPRANLRVDEIRIAGAERVNPETVRAALHSRPGTPFDAQTADEDMKRLYARGDFEGAGYALGRSEDGRQIMTVQVRENPLGPDYLRFGLGLSSDFAGNSYFNLLATHRRTWLNSLGAEWRNDLQVGHNDWLRTEWFQPLTVGQRAFAAAYGEVSRDPFDVFVNDLRIGRYRRKEWNVGADMGVSIGLSGEVRVGLRRGSVSLDTDTGFIPGNELVPSADTGGLAARLRWDTLDNLRFPRSGWALDLQYFRSQPRLGATDSYGKLDGSVQGAWSVGSHTVQAALFDTRGIGGGDMPDYELSSLGGFLRLSGFPTGRFLGTRTQLGRIVYRHRLSSGGLLDGMHVGVSAEAGRISDTVGTEVPTQNPRSNAIFLQIDTPIGPLYLARGRATTGEQATYFFLGLP